MGFAKTAASIWEARSCFRHNVGAKSLVAASPGSAWWVSQQLAPWPPTLLSPCWSCWASREKTKALTQHSTGGWGWMWTRCCRPTSANAERQPQCSWLASVVSHFSPNNTYLRNADIAPLFSDLCILPGEATSYRSHKQSGRSSFIAKRNSLQRWRTSFTRVSPCH